MNEKRVVLLTAERSEYMSTNKNKRERINSVGKRIPTHRDASKPLLFFTSGFAQAGSNIHCMFAVPSLLSDMLVQ